MQEFSVKEISQILSGLLKHAFPEMVAVTGEISQISNYNSSGHIYFSLKEGDAILNATYFKYFQSSGKFIPKIGDKVKVIGEIKSYDRTSSYQINVKKIEYNSEGVLWQQFEEMKRKLFAEGLFDETRKRPIPKYPYKVAVLTALNGAVIKDFVVTTKNEKGRYLVDVWNIPVQNIENAEIIANTILKVGKYAELYDVIVVMRGGGSMDDLSVFNQEVIARAVSVSKIPLISAIGHETDYTIIDYVADYRAATPTAAAVYLSSHYKTAHQLLEKEISGLGRNIINLLGKKNQQFDMAQLKLTSKSPSNILLKLNHKVKNFDNTLINIVYKKLYHIDKKLLQYERVVAAANPSKKLDKYIYKFEMIEKTLLRIIKEKYAVLSRRLKDDNKVLEKCVVDYLFDKNADVMLFESKLKLLDPKNVMDRGYAIITQKNKIISSVDNIDLNEDLNIMLKDGIISAYPEKINNTKNGTKFHKDQKVLK